MGPQGKTPNALLHGKNAHDKLVEFGEKVLWYAPKNIRAKLDSRWNIDVYFGMSNVSSENTSACRMGMW